LINRLRRLTGKQTLINTNSWFGVQSMLDGLDRQTDLPKAHVLSRLRITVNLFEFPETLSENFRVLPKNGQNRWKVNSRSLFQEGGLNFLPAKPADFSLECSKLVSVETLHNIDH